MIWFRSVDKRGAARSEKRHKKSLAATRHFTNCFQLWLPSGVSTHISKWRSDRRLLFINDLPEALKSCTRPGENAKTTVINLNIPKSDRRSFIAHRDFLRRRASPPDWTCGCNYLPASDRNLHYWTGLDWMTTTRTRTPMTRLDGVIQFPWLEQVIGQSGACVESCFRSNSVYQSSRWRSVEKCYFPAILSCDTYQVTSFASRRTNRRGEILDVDRCDARSVKWSTFGGNFRSYIALKMTCLAMVAFFSSS